MPPNLALFLTVSFSCYLFRQDREERSKTSGALWLPLLWMVIIAGRLPSQWLGLTSESAFEAHQQGSALDRAVFLMLICLAFIVLAARGLDWGQVLRENFFLALFLLYGLASILWSDYTFIAFKRWFRDLGIYLTILVVVADPAPRAALRLLLRRFGYLVLPLSVTLIKYFPELGRGYSEWTGQAFYMGVTTTKNVLGSICFVCGMFFVWDTLRLWKDRASSRRALAVNGVMLAMTLWLLRLADSATSTICLIAGAGMLVFLHLKRPSPRRLAAFLAAALVVIVPAELLFELSESVIRVSGRDVTLTGRTEVWQTIYSFARHPLLGAGYESFWLGDRLRTLWLMFPWRPNQAHNGYLEVFINLGGLGVGLVILLLFSTYQKVSRTLLVDYHLGALGISLLFCLTIYNVTEAAFKSHIMWYAFLLPSIMGPGHCMARQKASRPLRRGIPRRNAASPQSVRNSS